MPKLEEVFGISTAPIHSYATRQEVDGKFKEALQTDNHIVIYGSSKQGKTALRQRYLKDSDCVIVRCSPRSTTESIYSSILRQSGVAIETVETKSDGAKAGGRIRLGFKAKIPWIGSGATQAEAAGEKSNQHSITSEFVGFDFGESQAVAELLKTSSFEKIVVLENFHYLPLSVQRSLAFDLKTFHEEGIRFIILGIWREANLLLQHNGDLQDRVAEVPVEPWEEKDFNNVIELGCNVLNVEITENICRQFRTHAYGNIGMLQEFLRTFCALSDVPEALKKPKVLADEAKMSQAFQRKLHDQRGQLLTILQSIAGKSRTDSDDPLILPYYLVVVVLKADVDDFYLHGIHRKDLLEKIRTVHHRADKETIRHGDNSYLLSRLPALQQDISPPLLHYDSNQQRLRIVDTRQFFVLANVDRNELLDEIPNPLSTRAE